MPHSKRKVRKLRGSRTHGWGRTGQHRKSGSRGGKGKAGLDRHKKSWMIKYKPDHFGRHGFKRPWAPKKTTINVSELDEMIQSLVSTGKAETKEDKIFIDLNDMGIDKLLGNGTITQPLIIQVKSHSEKASEKVTKAGGQIISLSEDQTV